ncbi:MAG: hypothetical protein QOE70_1482 [Chthoniobacter sp.]|jgi:hypothetical protein|nr:hypothetical protein [Chthoniobacter sp.]
MPAAVVVLLVVLLCLSMQGSEPALAKTKAFIIPEVLAQLEKEVTRLDEQAESEPGPNFPRPSAQVAYHLLAGFAARGLVVNGLPEADAIFFQVDQRGGTTSRLLSIAPGARIAMISTWMQDKAGSYDLKTAILYLLRDGKWLPKGKGSIATVDQD